MSKIRLELGRAEGLAPGCERIEVAGSVRRRKAFVGDIEIVAISKMVERVEPWERF